MTARDNRRRKARARRRLARRWGSGGWQARHARRRYRAEKGHEPPPMGCHACGLDAHFEPVLEVMFPGERLVIEMPVIAAGSASIWEASLA